jgi:hypothetical protein
MLEAAGPKQESVANDGMAHASEVSRSNKSEVDHHVSEFTHALGVSAFGAGQVSALGGGQATASAEFESPSAACDSQDDAATLEEEGEEQDEPRKGWSNVARAGSRGAEDGGTNSQK